MLRNGKPSVFLRQFTSDDDAKSTIRAAIRYLLRGATDGVRGDIVQGIVTIVRQVANETSSGQQDSLDDGMPGGSPPRLKEGRW